MKIIKLNGEKEDLGSKIMELERTETIDKGKMQNIFIQWDFDKKAHKKTADELEQSLNENKFLHQAITHHVAEISSLLIERKETNEKNLQTVAEISFLRSELEQKKELLIQKNAEKSEELEKIRKYELDLETARKNADAWEKEV